MHARRAPDKPMDQDRPLLGAMGGGRNERHTKGLRPHRMGAGIALGGPRFAFTYERMFTSTSPSGDEHDRSWKSAFAVKPYWPVGPDSFDAHRSLIE